MYYYGYKGGYANNGFYRNNACCYGNTGYNYRYGYGPAIILVLFILLVIIFGAGFWNNHNN